MIATPMGNILLRVEGQQKGYDFSNLPTQKRNYAVDARYRIMVDDLTHKKNIECLLDKPKEVSEGFEDSGEDLALISFYKGKMKLSIGVEGDVEGIRYIYLENGIQMIIGPECKKESLAINVAWLTMKNEEVEEIYTWFAADPTID